MKESKTDKYKNPVQATVTGILDLFRKQHPAGELKEGDRLEGKRVLITGSSSGLGLATAKKLARRGAEVIMAVRSGIPARGEEVQKAGGSEKVHMIHVDLSDIDSILALAGQVKDQFNTIDILICNAGTVPTQSRKTNQGLEQMFVVNYFAKFILVNKLLELDVFRRTGDRIPRIIFVASETHRNPGVFDLEGFGEYREFRAGRVMELYGYHKLLLVTLANELSRRLNQRNQTDYSAFALCPGPVNSNIAREAPKIFRPMLKLIFTIFFRSPEKACEPVVYLAASGDVEGRKIDYLFRMSRREMDEKATDPTNGKELWEKSLQLTKRIENSSI